MGQSSILRCSRLGESLPKIIEELSKQKVLVAWFLILWGVSFFFSGLNGLLWVSEGYLSGAELVIEVLWDLTELALAAILIMLGRRVREVR